MPNVMSQPEKHPESLDGDVLPDLEWAGRVRCPGLTPDAAFLESWLDELGRSLAVFRYRKDFPGFWIAFLGGTGTGKSTLFNAICGEELSATGVERPKTAGAVLYAHKNCLVERHFPFPAVPVVRQAAVSAGAVPTSGRLGEIVLLEHDREDLNHLVFADTPDLDSVEAANRRIAEDLHDLSDGVVFVSSQEKYADDVPYRFLVRVAREGRPFYLLLNKAEQRMTREEVLEVLETEDVRFSADRLWLLPYTPGCPWKELPSSPAFQEFRKALLQDFSKERLGAHRTRRLRRESEKLAARLESLLTLLDAENRAAESWRRRLDALLAESTRRLIEEEQKRFSAESRAYLQAEIRRLFTKYDVLAKPRRFVREILLAPLRLLGMRGPAVPESHEKTLEKIRRKIDLHPIHAALDHLNRRVLEDLSPADADSPLYRKMRQPGMELSREEVREIVWKAQDELVLWLEETFARLAKGIPRSKEWGIYSTSILWGVLIVSLEAVVGGGLSGLDVALDSALAPFVTKGAVELFAYHEIQRLARELAERYQAGLLSVVREQRDRYERALQSLMTDGSTRQQLESWKSALRARHREAETA